MDNAGQAKIEKEQVEATDMACAYFYYFYFVILLLSLLLSFSFFILTQK